MDGIGAELYKLERNKNYDWADKQVRMLRLWWQPIFPSDEAAINRSYLMCQQNMNPTKEKFKKASSFYKDTKWKTLPVMHKIINRLSELLIQYPPKCEVKSSDPTAISGKQEEINLLRTRKIFEQGLNRANKIVGDPPSRLDLKKEANSNIADFDKLQMDDTDEEDLSTFEEFLQKMDYEIAAQEVINQSMKVNRFDEFNLREALIDIAATCALGYDVYVDEITGAQTIRRIAPEDMRGIWGERYDGSDDIAKGWEKRMPLRDFLGMVGNNFNMERDWQSLIWGINGCNNTKFTGFKFSDRVFDTWGTAACENEHRQFGCTESNLVPVSQAYRYDVYAVKCEWYAPEEIGTPYLMDRGTNELSPTSATFDQYQGDEKMFKQYTYESEVRWCAYNAIGLGYTLTTQKLFKWGEVYLQQPEGAYDEYCIGTLKYYRLPGIPIGEVVQNYIDTANEAYFKIRWILDKAKPRAKQLIFNEIIAMARALGTDKNSMLTKDGKVSADSTDTLEKVFTYMEEHVQYDIRFYPQVRGMDVPQLPSLRQADEGIDPLTVALQAIETWAENQVMDKIGLYDLLNANPREGLGQQKMLTEESQHQIGYISRIIQFCKKDVATALLNYTHDVIKYKQSIACKWLQVLLGEDKFLGLQNLGKYAPHRMGIFINDYYTAKMKADVDRMVDIAMEKGAAGVAGGITIFQGFFIKNAEDYKQEMKLLEIFMKKQDKKVFQRELQKQKQIQDHQKELANINLQAVREEQGMKLEGNKIIAAAQIEVAKINNQGKVDVKKITVDSEGAKQADKTLSAKEIATHEADLKQQEATAT